MLYLAIWVLQFATQTLPAILRMDVGNSVVVPDDNLLTLTLVETTSELPTCADIAGTFVNTSMVSETITADHLSDQNGSTDLVEFPIIHRGDRVNCHAPITTPPVSKTPTRAQLSRTVYHDGWTTKHPELEKKDRKKARKQGQDNQCGPLQSERKHSHGKHTHQNSA